MSQIFFFFNFKRQRQFQYHFYKNLRYASGSGGKHEWLLSKQFYYYAMEHTFLFKENYK